MTVIVIVVMGLYVLIAVVIAFGGIFVSLLRLPPLILTPKCIVGLFPISFKLLSLRYAINSSAINQVKAMEQLH